MIVKDVKDGKLISLSSPLDTKGKYLFLFYFIVLFIGGIVSVRGVIKSITDDEITWVGVVVLSVLAFGLFLGAYRFLNKAVESEKIFLDKTSFQLIHTGFLKFKVKTYEVSKVAKFRHLEKPEVPKHPLAGESIDYLGFQTEQIVINEMHGDNRISFSYSGNSINFGQNVSSWEFEELEGLIYNMTGYDLRNTDLLEKTGYSLTLPNQAVIEFYQDLIDEIAVSNKLQIELKTIVNQAIDHPESFYDESGNFILSPRGLTYSGHRQLTSKFVLVDKMIAAKQMVEVDWKEAEEDIRIWISEIAKTKGYRFDLSLDKKYAGDTFDSIISIDEKELQPEGYCLEMINIDSDSYVFTIIPLSKQPVVRNMFDKIK